MVVITASKVAKPIEVGLASLRLGGMETTISRLRQSLKLEDAANALLANGAVN